jgi:16S rRNA processing protein RimM
MEGITNLRSSTRGEGPPHLDGADDVEPVVAVAGGLTLRGAGGRLTATLVPGGVDQFRDRSWIYVGRMEGPRTRYRIEEYKTYGRKVVLSLAGIDSAASAEPLVGLDILIPCKGLVDLPEGAHYIFELVGLKVLTQSGRLLGHVRTVAQTGGTPLLVIDPATGSSNGADMEEILVPISRSICRVIDKASGRIVIEPPDGLLDLYGI